MAIKREDLQTLKGLCLGGVAVLVLVKKFCLAPPGSPEEQEAAKTLMACVEELGLDLLDDGK